MNRNLKQYFKQSAVFVFTAMFAVMLSFTFGTKIHAESVAPSDLTQTEETSSSVKISWKSPYDSNHQYHIEKSENGVNWSELKATPNTSTIISDLAAGSSYYIRIYTTDANDDNPSPYSEVLEIVTKTSDTLNVYQSDATSNSFTLSWNPIAGATEYRIYSQDSTISYGTQKQLLATTQNCSYTLHNFPITSDKIYFYVYPVRTTANKQYSAVAEVNAGSINNIQSVPSKVTGCKKQAWDFENASSSTTLSIAWKALSNLSGYEVNVYDTKNNCVYSNSTTATELNISNVLSKTSCYYFKVRAYININNKRCYGEWSANKWVVPHVTGTIKKSTKKRTITVKWNKITGATKYDIYMKVPGDSSYTKVKSLDGTKKQYVISKFKGKKLNSKNLARKGYYTVSIVAKKKVGNTTYTSK